MHLIKRHPIRCQKGQHPLKDVQLVLPRLRETSVQVHGRLRRQARKVCLRIVSCLESINLRLQGHSDIRIPLRAVV